jgi:predicted anti-sigma-YlaC factor YlaD
LEDERIVAGLHCGEVQADLTESLDGRLSRERSLRVEEHLDECGECRRLSGEIAAAVRALRELPDEPLAPEIEARLLARLLAPSPSGETRAVD